MWQGRARPTVSNTNPSDKLAEPGNRTEKKPVICIHPVFTLVPAMDFFSDRLWPGSPVKQTLSSSKSFFGVVYHRYTFLKIILHQKLHKSPTYSCINDCLNFIIGSIWQVGEGPAGISQYISVTDKQQPRKDIQTGRNLEKKRWLDIQQKQREVSLRLSDTSELQNGYTSNVWRTFQSLAMCLVLIQLTELR